MKRFVSAVSALLLLSACGGRSSVENDTVSNEAISETAVAREGTEEVQEVKDTHSYEFSSPYDSHKLSYWVREPQNPSVQPLTIILLGDADKIQSLQEQLPEHWLVYIPSRPLMNYQLLAEGDFWAMMKDAEAKHPNLGLMPKILLGVDSAAGIALALANDYRYRFDGVAASGQVTRLHYPNLVNFPVVTFEDSSLASPKSTWNTKHISEMLVQHNSPVATALVGDINKAIETLAGQLREPDFPSSYSFQDYQYAQAWPWLRIVSKLSEDETATLEADVDGDTLILTSNNISAVEVHRSRTTPLPNEVTKIRFNGELFVLSGRQSRITLGDHDFPKELRRKSDSPSGFQNFWRNEPLVIVYQDKDQDPAFLAASKSYADAMSRMQFAGLPTLAVDLPVVALSNYEPANHGLHRAVFIGDPAVLKSRIEARADRYPLQLQGHELYLSGRETSVWLDSEADLAYGLCAVPDDDRYLRIALILAAKDLRGLQTVLQAYTSATSLTADSDLLVWVREDKDYQRKLQLTFDSYWGPTNIPTFAVDVPSQPEKIWELFLSDLLKDETQELIHITDSLVARGAPPPTKLTEATLKRFLPDRRFAIVTVNEANDVHALNQIIANSPLITLYGCEAITSNADPAGPRLDPDQLRSGQTLLVDATALDLIPWEQRQKLSYALLPESLHQMIRRRLTASGPRFGRDLLRTASTFYSEPESLR